MKLNKQTKQELRNNNSTDSQRLFRAAWRKILAFNRDADIDDIQGLYEIIVAEMVNNPSSRFYMYG